MRRAILAFALAVLVLGAFERSLADVAGGRGGPTTLSGRLRGADGRDSVTAQISFHREEFQISAVHGKYKMLRVRIENHTATPLALSPLRDRLELVLRDNARVGGLLDLQATDSATWDAFSAEIRQALAYPVTIRAAPGTAAGGIGSPEVVYLFVFYPSDRVPGLPMRFDYWIDSLQQSIAIEAPPPRTARAN